MAVFIRLTDVPATGKGVELRRALRSECGKVRFEWEPKDFTKIPGSPFAYWITSGITDTFSRLLPLQGRGMSAVSGGKTLDDFRFIRAWWEIVGSPSDWPGFAKGGAFSPFYADVFLTLDWRKNAAALKAYLVEYRSSRSWSPNWTAELHGSDHYRRPGLTWPRRTNGLSVRVMPRGCVFADKGPAAFHHGDQRNDLLAMCALMNSRPFGYLVSVQLARTELAQSFEVGLIQQTPVPELSVESRAKAAGLAGAIWSAKRQLDSVNETSHAYLLPTLLRERDALFDPSALRARISDLADQIDDWAFQQYEFGEGDRAFIDPVAKSQAVLSPAPEAVTDDGDESASEADEILVADAAASFLSWSVGVACARFDIRIATGERPAPPEPDPFDPLPVSSPAMLPDGDPPFLPTSGIFVDDPGHPDDLTARVTAVYERVGEVAPVPDDLRLAMAKNFFPAHIRLYSRSRRKAPIYWQFATQSASYSVWLYIHAASKDTLFRVQNDYLAPKFRDQRQQLDRLLAEAGTTPSSAQSRAIEVQAAFVEELSSMLEEVRRVAPLWDPDLDDGVILNFAPLWRLVPQNRAWQKECRAAWDALLRGDYDWAHIAMRLWPERVVPKCAEDRSLAIAHDLEEVFWADDDDGKWIARRAPTRLMEDLIAERTSPAVKAALTSLLEAPEPVTASRRRGRAAGT